MTPEMIFECLLVTPDPAVANTMGGILEDFSIETKACSRASKAARLLADEEEDVIDLVVIDLEAQDSAELLEQIGSRTRQKPTVLAVSGADGAAPGVHVILRKPVTRESGITSLKAAYSRMVHDYRKHTRFAVMTRSVAIDEENRNIAITVTNIGEGGVGLTCIETLRVGGLLSFQIQLPELQNRISVRARVLWTRPYGAAGCEFVNISSFNLQLLRAWLESRYRIRRPVIPV
jgi:CheY-like chemotaxis protein